jgi:hypothetical protein
MLLQKLHSSPVTPLAGTQTFNSALLTTILIPRAARFHALMRRIASLLLLPPEPEVISFPVFPEQEPSTA